MDNSKDGAMLQQPWLEGWAGMCGLGRGDKRVYVLREEIPCTVLFECTLGLQSAVSCAIRSTAHARKSSLWACPTLPPGNFKPDSSHGREEMAGF